MTKAKFEIGETEKHAIIVNANSLPTAIEMDGEKVVKESHFSSCQKSSSLR